MLEGTRPQDTESVGWTRNAFPDPEAALGRRAREISYPTDLGDAPAWFVPGRSSTWAVLVHGKGESRVEMLRLMRSTVGAGLPSMAITYRNDVGAPQEPSHRYQYGRTEWRDLAKAVDYATEHGADRVVLVGASMGGGIIASYLQHTPSHPRVAGLVLDAPMLDLGETVSYGASQRPLPLFGHVPGALTWTAKRLATLRYGLDWSAVNYADDSELAGRADAGLPRHRGHHRADRAEPAAGRRPPRPGPARRRRGRAPRRRVERRPAGLRGSGPRLHPTAVTPTDAI